MTLLWVVAISFFEEFYENEKNRVRARNSYNEAQNNYNLPWFYNLSCVSYDKSF